MTSLVLWHPGGSISHGELQAGACRAVLDRGQDWWRCGDGCPGMLGGVGGALRSQLGTTRPGLAAVTLPARIRRGLRELLERLWAKEP